MADVDTKLLLKIQEQIDEATQYKWVHICYVNTPVYEEFTKQFNTDEPLNTLLSIWCKEDFQVDLNMATSEDLKTLKDLIKEHYKNKYPDLYRDDKIDRQGWTRIWLTDKMRKAIENGKISE